MINISKTIHLMKKGIYRLITGKSIYKEYKNSNLEWINYSHASPEGSMPFKNLFLFKEAIRHLSEKNLQHPIIEIGTFC
jgi:hypothetical protein